MASSAPGDLSIASAWERPQGTADDPSKYKLLSQKMAAVMKKAMYPTAMRISPHAIGISPLNRLFSVRQVHNTILRSFVQDGFSEDRPQVGICCEVRDSAKRRSLQHFNEELAAT